MTELSFLIELLLNHDLPKPTKDLIAERIKEVEQNLAFKPQASKPVIVQPPRHVSADAEMISSMVNAPGEVGGDARQRSIAAAIAARKIPK